MDYMTKPLSRIAIRQISKYVRRIFGLNEYEPFPVLEILERTCIIFDRTEYSVLEDDKLPQRDFPLLLKVNELPLLLSIVHIKSADKFLITLSSPMATLTPFMPIP